MYQLNGITNVANAARIALEQYDELREAETDLRNAGTQLAKLNNTLYDRRLSGSQYRRLRQAYNKQDERVDGLRVKVQKLRAARVARARQAELDALSARPRPP